MAEEMKTQEEQAVEEVKEEAAETTAEEAVEEKADKKEAKADAGTKLPSAQDLIKEIEDSQIKEVTDFNVGDTVRVHVKIVEGNRERIQVFEGLVLKRQGGSNRATFTVRKLSNGIGVERTWPLYSPSIAKIEVVRRGKVRRAKLNYIRQRVGKAAKVKELVK